MSKWARSTLEERKEWGQVMAKARRPKGYKQSPEWVRKRTESMKATLKKKVEAGWIPPFHYSRRDPQELALTHIYRQYRTKANNRGLEFNLTRDEVSYITSQNCVYCEDVPRERMVGLSHYPIQVIANGIDRVDNSKGYVPNNCVSCCLTCNLMKNKSSLEEFKNQIKWIYQCLFS